jgi:hypothetical protein
MLLSLNQNQGDEMEDFISIPAPESHLPRPTQMAFFLCLLTEYQMVAHTFQTKQFPAFDRKNLHFLGQKVRNL